MSDSFDVIMAAAGASETIPAVDGMVWVPGGTFLMGSDRHYPEEAPARPATVGGFWIDSGPVTNAEFARFVRKTGHVTAAEIAPDPADYPGARPDLLVPFSAVFIPPRRQVSLADPHNWWTPVAGADWRHPQGPGSSIRASRIIRSSISPGRMPPPTRAGRASRSRPRPSGNWPPAAGWTARNSPGATS